MVAVALLHFSEVGSAGGGEQGGSNTKAALWDAHFQKEVLILASRL